MAFLVGVGVGMGIKEAGVAFSRYWRVLGILLIPIELFGFGACSLAKGKGIMVHGQSVRGHKGRDGAREQRRCLETVSKYGYVRMVLYG